MIKEIALKMPIKKLLTTTYPYVDAEEIINITPDIGKKITKHPSFQEGIAEVALPSFCDLSYARSVVIFDNVQDPGNIGTLLRTAHALGFEGAHLYGHCADPFHPKSLSASKGSALLLPLGQGELLPFTNHHLYGAEAGGQDYTTLALQEPYALIFGNEGQGLSEEIKIRAKSVAIPLAQGVDSLNVSAAAAILCAWAKRGGL